MRLRNRQALARGETPVRNHSFVPYANISTHLRHAVLVAEDDAFWDHPGYDEKQIRKAIEKNWEEKRFARGASTITQQLARNLFLSPSKNPWRKLKELVLARRMETELGKKRILELYLNVIEWGEGIWGCEAAARVYFGKGCGSFYPEEAATLAAIVPNPRARDPRRANPVITKRKQRILQLMRRRGYLTEAQYQASRSRPVRTLPPP